MYSQKVHVCREQMNITLRTAGRAAAVSNLLTRRVTTVRRQELPNQNTLKLIIFDFFALAWLLHSKGRFAQPFAH